LRLAISEVRSIVQGQNFSNKHRPAYTLYVVASASNVP
jgi:hypothetical protein